jgi:hypothetical protein
MMARRGMTTPRAFAFAFGAFLCVAHMALAEPILSIDITAAAGEDLGDAFAAARAVGATTTSVSILWDDIEPTRGTYAPHDNWPAAVNAFFPWTGFDFTLTFAPIDTLADRRPADLKGLPWDDPAVIDAFTAHIDTMLQRLQSLRFIAVSIGNEVDALLTTDADAAAYTRFFIAARTHLRRLHPDLPVGTKLTFAGLMDAPARWAPLIAASDALMVTYYPLGANFHIRDPAETATDIDALVTLAADKPLWLMETGYPSEGCNASETGQTRFAMELVAAMQRHPTAIALVSWTFFTDLPQDQVAELTAYYGLQDDCFARYLRTLGLRQVDGTAKAALGVLQGTTQP